MSTQFSSDAFKKNVFDALSKATGETWKLHDTLKDRYVTSNYLTAEKAKDAAENARKKFKEMFDVDLPFSSGASSSVKGDVNCRAAISSEAILALISKAEREPTQAQPTQAPKSKVKEPAITIKRGNDKFNDQEFKRLGETLEKLHEIAKEEGVKVPRQWTRHPLASDTYMSSSPLPEYEAERIVEVAEEKLKINIFHKRIAGDDPHSDKFHIYIPKGRLDPSRPVQHSSTRLKSPKLPVPLPSRDPNVHVDEKMLDTVKNYLNKETNYFGSGLPRTHEHFETHGPDEVARIHELPDGNYRITIRSILRESPFESFNVSKAHILGWAQAAKEGV